MGLRPVMRKPGSRIPAAILAAILPLGGLATEGKAPALNTVDKASTAAPATLPTIPLHPRHVAVGGVPPASAPLNDPRSRTPEIIAEGALLFTTMHCDGCHGPGAVGGAGPSLMDGRWRYGETTAEIFESIYAGRAGGMPAFGGVLSAAMILALSAYLQSLTPAVDPATTVYPP